MCGLAAGPLTYPAEKALKGTLRLSTCSNVCILTDYPFTLAVDGAVPDLRGQSLGLLLTSGEQAWQGKGTSGAPLALPIQSNSLFWLLWAALLSGLILNLMPCVLPVLALKLGSVLQHQEREQGTIRKQFLAASAGIITSFWVLAAMSSMLRATQGAVGWDIQFQNTGFIGFMVLVTLLFCANLLGLFEIRLPSSLSTRLATSGGNGLGGHFLQGSFATLLATPCSAPFLGTAVAFALAAPLGHLWLIFTTLRIGMSLPWLLVAALSRPRPLVAKTGALDEPSAHSARADDAGIQPLADQSARQPSRQL